MFVTFRSMDTKTVYVAQTTSELLSCSEERLLWISWHDGQVAVGRGREMGHDIVMAYEEMNSFRLTALSVTTDGSSGTWRFPIKQGRCLKKCHITLYIQRITCSSDGEITNRIITFSDKLLRNLRNALASHYI